jgi:glycosyltransferase involved in cell wall biosynthesis
MPTISVIIPVYNGQKTIQETLASVLNQRFGDFEVIVVNDGSQDATLEIINSINDYRIKVFSYPNTGVSASRNRGIDQAKGEFIAFLDADDLWTSDKLEKQLKALQANPQAALAYSWSDWIDESGHFLRSGGHITVNGKAYDKLLVRDFIESGSNPLIRKQALAQVGGFDGSITHGEDWEMWLRIAACYEFVAVPFPQILYRVYPESASFEIGNMEAGSLAIIERVFAQKPELAYLKRETLASRYKYLTFKALEGTLERKNGLIAARFLIETLKNDLSLLGQTKLILIVLIKIAIAILLPPQLKAKLLNTVQKST